MGFFSLKLMQITITFEKHRRYHSIYSVSHINILGLAFNLSE